MPIFPNLPQQSIVSHASERRGVYLATVEALHALRARRGTAFCGNGGIAIHGGGMKQKVIQLSSSERLYTQAC
jgi:hypothetical protein